MPSLSGEVILTNFNAHYEPIDFGNNKYIINKIPNKQKKGNSLWRDQLMSSLKPFSPFRSKKEKAKLFIMQDELFNKVNREAIALNIRKQSLFIGTEPEYVRKLSKTGSSGTISDEYQSDSDSERTASGSYTSAECSSLSSSDSSVFGSNYNVKNNGLFLSNLSLDDFDHIPGPITWNSINTKADLVLDYLCSRCSRKVNRVLPSATDFVCPDPNLQNRLLLSSKKSYKPLKRWNSYEDIQGLAQPRTWTNTSVSSDDQTFCPRDSSKPTPIATAKHMDSHRKGSADSTKELTILGPISSPVVFQNQIPTQKRSVRVSAKSLLANIRAPSPLSLALYLTKVDKQYMMRLKDYQIFNCMIGDMDFDNQRKDLTELRDIFDLSSELNKFVVGVIRRQITPESQARKIAGFIEVACALRKLRNWHSLVAVINAIQSPKVYAMEEAWMSVKKLFPVHFSDYTKLCRLVRLNQTCIIGSTIGGSIPSLASLLSKITIHCIAAWDLLEHKRRWTEQPSIAGWVDNELIGQLVESQKQREKQEEQYMLSMEPNKHSLLPESDPIRLIPLTSLPVNWRQRDIQYLRQTLAKPIVRCLQSSFEKEIQSIRKYTIPAPFT